MATADNHTHEQAAVTPGLEQASLPATCNTASAHASRATVSTILSYYPLRDAISILIILLSLPPTLVLIIQTLFASLTFVPPTAGLSLSTLPNIKEMFNSPNFGYPAMATILLVDCLVALIWLPLWKPAQAIFLDLSQAVIAVSLSGAAGSTGGPTYSIATCTLLVCVVHVLRYKAIHLTALDYLRSVLHKLDGSPSLDASSSTQSFYSLPIMERGIFFNAFRTILGIHIVSQGVTTCIRRTLANAKASEKDLHVPVITKTDTEALAGAEPPTRSSSGLAESSQPSHTTTSNDGRPPGQPPSHRESKARDTSNKKKRKQANQVRSQQPLWAAIASTKVTFVKEMEQRDAVDDAREAATMDDTSKCLATAPETITDRIWICEVRDTEIYFAVDLSQDSAAETAEGDDCAVPVTAGIDRSKPFFVRINGAAWSSTRLTPIGNANNSGSYKGEIFGLAPLSSYTCEIVSISSQRVLCSASLITQPAPTAEQAAVVPAPPQHQALRPSSPITTLKQSIQSAETKLNEVKNRTRKTKKDQRAVHAEIKREINSLRSKLEASTGIDDRQERRLQQISQHKNQAEEATRELQAQIDAFGEVPADEMLESQSKRRLWQSAMDAMRAAQREFDNTKSELEREANALRAELSASESRKEKLIVRKAQRASDLEKLRAKQQADVSAKQKRELERAQAAQEREQRQKELFSHISSMEAEISTLGQKAREAWQQASALSNWSTQPPPGPSYSSPPTPEGVLPGTAANGQASPPTNGLGSAAFGPQLYSSPFPNSSALPAGSHRGRSSSMLSQYSGFTDNGEDVVFTAEQHQQHARPLKSQGWPPAPVNVAAGASQQHRKASDGGNSQSGSASTSGSASLINGNATGSNSPRPEARPFIPGSVGATVKPPLGVIGPPMKRTPPQSPSDRLVNPGANGNGR
jgi:septal ring factor EnvC (AmiA/AmiB activator)